MRALSLFSGIGGLDIAAHAAGIETVAFCEIEPFAAQVIGRRFPAVDNHGDITRFTNRTLRELGGSPFQQFKCPADYNGTIDVVHGGFPCQDLSVAGKQRGLSGERSGLWYEMLRVVSELRPAYVLAENVRGACNLALPAVVSGLEGEGYEVRASVVPASAFGAPHKRERLFVLGIRKDVADAVAERLQGGERGCSFLEQGAPALEPASERCEGRLWPTPSVHGNYNRRGLSENSGDGLATAVKMWPTPHRNCSNGAGVHGDGGMNIQTAVKMWLTPSVEDGGRKGSTEWGERWANGETPPTCHQRLRTQVLAAKSDGGSLNPAWVEILMGFPMGWTDPDCDEPEPWPGWPAGMGELQYPYEPPRTGRNIPNRAARLKALGNAVVPAQAYPFFEAIAIMEEVRTQCNTASSM